MPGTHQVPYQQLSTSALLGLGYMYEEAFNHVLHLGDVDEF